MFCRLFLVLTLHVVTARVSKKAIVVRKPFGEKMCEDLRTSFGSGMSSRYVKEELACYLSHKDEVCNEIKTVSRRSVFRRILSRSKKHVAIKKRQIGKSTQPCGDIQETLKGKASMRPYKKVPHTCADIKRDDPEARDGEYWLFPKAPQFHGGRVKIYCLINTTHQLEYLTLPNKNIGVYPKYSNTYCGDEIPLSNEIIKRAGDTYFFKIRINATNMSAIDDDFTFARSSQLVPMKYGHAYDCYSEGIWSCGPNGTFYINTRGTGMKFNPNVTWNKYGHLPHDPQIAISSNGSVIDLKCGGSCGGCDPESPLTLYPDTWQLS